MILRVEITLRSGDTVRYLGSGLSSPSVGDLKPNALGIVREVKPPVHGTGAYLAEVNDVDRGRDGYAVVEFEGWGKRHVLLPDGEGTRWERVPASSRSNP